MSEVRYLSDLLGSLPRAFDSFLTKNHNHSICSTPSDAACLPPYMLQGLWWVLWLMGVEYLVLWWQGARLPHLHDNILSLTHATFYEVSKTAIILIILIDLCYYWFHRASHEIMVLWAIHQVHHSSQYLTMTVGLRHSPLQRLFSWVFYLPLAVLGVPPAYMLSHIQFNLLYQCWLHTEAISTLGPLEYIFNTPNHHRVHHGCNMYCLDKNYGGIFIVWDHLFSTFQPYKKDVHGLRCSKYPQLPEMLWAVSAGCVHWWSSLLRNSLQTDPARLPVYYMKMALEKSFNMDNFWDGLAALIKGPSWIPGLPWTGCDGNKIDVPADREYMAAKATSITHVYILLHLLAAITITSHLTTLTLDSGLSSFGLDGETVLYAVLYPTIFSAKTGDHNITLVAVTVSVSPMEVFVYSMMVVAALTCIGILYEQPHYTRTMEVWRCAAGLLLSFLLPPPASTLSPLLMALYTASLAVWILHPAIVLTHHHCKQQ
ncbi:hypothetical protein Pmani_021130 [Petrolisthes manimaculis]|uniref:Fatty acid hydroxylase domain-containing protein n=1 Tax=Petrolisthes manimaculis TaxID=1843537 RepID=A0AAE1PGZ8_9EUCA|nr:hypothetical protein Pmani_021130 [Petrolisthes manimaculis]